MSNVSDALGQGADYGYKGKTYRVSPWAFGVQGDYEVYVRGEAFKKQRESLRWKTQDEANADRQQLDRDIAAGLYSFGGDELARTLRHPQHLAFLFHLMLKKGHPEVTPVLTREMVDSDWNLVMEKINEANGPADPTKGAPPEEEKTHASPA